MCSRYLNIVKHEQILLSVDTRRMLENKGASNWFIQRILKNKQLVRIILSFPLIIQLWNNNIDEAFK